MMIGQFNDMSRSNGNDETALRISFSNSTWNSYSSSHSPEVMTKQESCDSISDILKLDHPELSEGSTIPGEFLHNVLRCIDSEVKAEGKHETFDEILKILGVETSDDYKSEGSTITEYGIATVHDSLKDWNQLSQRMMGPSTTPDPKAISRSILVDYLSEWTSTIKQYTENPQELFAALDIELDQYPAVNDSGILSIHHVQFCLSRIPEEPLVTGAAEDVTDNTDTSEDSPSASYLVSAINAQQNTEGIETLINRIKRGLLDLNPPWQRQVVWAPAKQKALIRSVVLGFPLPSIILFRPKGGVGMEIVDGKQRLTSLLRFLDGQIPFPRVKPQEDVQLNGFRLMDCSNKAITHPDFPSACKETILSSLLHTSTLIDVEQSTIYDVFTIYNSKGTRLNAAEIRNAAYQEHAVHKAMVERTGELVEERVWDSWTTNFRNLVGNGNPNALRYKYLGFIERYLGYSRAHPELGRTGFMKLTTAKSIKAFYDTESGNSRAAAKRMTAEVVTVFDRCQKLVPNPFGDPTGKFHALKATNSMILIRLLGPLLDDGDIKVKRAEELFREIYSKVQIPDNQNSGTIWQYHIDSIQELWNLLPKMQKKKMDGPASNYLEKLLPDRWD